MNDQSLSRFDRRIAELLVEEFGDDAPIYARRIKLALAGAQEDPPAVALWCMALTRLGLPDIAEREMERLSHRPPPS